MGFFDSFFGWLPAGIQAVLVWLAQTTGNAGVAIILLTVLVRLLLFPLTRKQTQSMLAMKELQPKLLEIQKKYKDKPEEYNRRVLELYREKGVNPFGGCLPVLIQLPVLYALFTVLRTYTFEGVGAGFLIWTLTDPDPTYLLPILSGVTTYFMSAMTSTGDPSQKMMLYIMPVFLAGFSIQFPSGLVLYWVVNNIFSIAQQYVLSKTMAPAVEGGAKAK